MASVLSRIQIIMEANTANYNNELRRAQQNSGKNFGKIKKAAKAMALGVGTAVVGMGVQSLKTAGQFESAMNGVRAVSGATGEDFTKLRDTAKELGSTTAYSATEAANGMEYLAMAGMNTEQVLATIPNALNLAAAGGIELAQSADILSNVITGMGLAAEDSGRAADVLAATAAGANVDIAMLGDSMKFAAPIAKQLGLSLEETAATIGVMGNAGIQGSMAGTALRAVYTRLATHDKAKAHFEALGIEIADSSGKMKSMVDIFKELEVASKNMTAQEKLAMYKETVGAEAMSAFGVTIDSISDGSLSNLINKLETSEGAAKKMADIKMEGLQGALKGLASAWEGFQIQLADGGALSLAASAVNAVADGLRELTKNLPQIIANFQSFTESIGLVEKLQFVWGNLVSVVMRTAEVLAPVINFFREHEELSKSLAIAIGVVAGAIVIYNAAIVVGAAATVAFGAAIAILTSPITLTIVAITALVAAGVYLYRNWDEIKAKATEVWGAITGYIGGKITEIKNHFSTNFPAMTAIVSAQIGVIKSVVVGGFNLVKNTVQTVLAVIKAVIAGDFGAIPGIIGQGLKNAVGIVKNMMGSILNVIKETGSKLYQVGADMIQGLINGVKSKAAAAKNAIKDTASSMYQGVKDFFIVRSPSRLMRELGVNIVDGLIVGIKDKESDAYKAAVSVANSVLDGIASTRKSIALFGNDSAVAAFDYDVLIGKYDDIAPSLREKYRADLLKLEQMKREEQQRASITTALQGRFSQFGKDKATAGDSLQGMLGGLEQQSPMGKIQAEYEARNAIIEQYENTHTNMVSTANEARIASDQAYMDAKRDLMLTQGESLFGDMAGLAKAFVGEQSGIYRGLFAVEKIFAMAQSAMAIQVSIAKAMSVGFPANIPLIGQAVAQGAKIASNIKSIAMPVGQAHDGIANIPREGTWVLDKNERVVKADDNKKLSQFLDSNEKRGAGVNITINNNSSASVSAKRNADGTVTIDMVDKMIEKSFRRIGRANSLESKSIQRHTTARVKR